VLAFTDSYWQAEFHAGYLYQKYYLLNSSGLWGGIGYTPMIFIKPRWTDNEPIPIPGIGLSSSLKYKNFTVIATFASILFINAKIDF
jgi:hypothetical protein